MHALSLRSDVISSIKIFSFFLAPLADSDKEKVGGESEGVEKGGGGHDLGEVALYLAGGGSTVPEGER